MGKATELHAAVKRGDLPAMRRLLEAHPRLANAPSEADERGAFPLHVAAEAGQAAAARLLLEYGADIAAKDLENDAIALGGVEGRWRKLSNATLEDWRRAAAMIRTKGGVE